MTSMVRGVMSSTTKVDEGTPLKPKGQLCPSDHDITPENAPLRQNIPPVVETRTLGDQQDEDQEENREKQSPSSSSTDQKKPRKRPHYLSHEVRCQIIERIAGGEQQAALAREFGVTRAAVCHIQKHRFEILSRPVAQQTGDEDTIPTGPALDQQLVHEVRTSSMFLLLTTLRDRRTDVSTFRRAAGRVIMILLEDVLGQLDSRPVEIVTANGHVATGIERRSPLCGVKLGDEGHPFSVLFHQLEVDAAEGKLYVNRATDERGRRYWRLEGMNLPASIALCKVLLFTATCSTGERECKAIEALCGVGTMEKDITLVSIMCASDAVVTVCSRFPQVRIVTAAIDSSVDPRTEYIIPGLGNFIARYYNEDVRFNV
ncbi:Uracil phosphoribosyltransferase [Phytophthora cinnamomi]|uniref:Uracil phosphoribosyltransferase n=1 Tax=Phytophthora cinnamomi TaxID=4785 RepID=UPI0035596365|nr:Uracil phosphoribosyltransferase [Phytophthora cinnamomi]